MTIGEADTAEILAGRYVDGTQSYTQALREAKSVAFQKKHLMLRSLHGEQLSVRLRGARDSGDRMTTYKFVDKMGDAKCSRKHMTFS